jgi:hypothetical protein
VEELVQCLAVCEPARKRRACVVAVRCPAIADVHTLTTSTGLVGEPGVRPALEHFCVNADLAVLHGTQSDAAPQVHALLEDMIIGRTH